MLSAADFARLIEAAKESKLGKIDLDQLRLPARMFSEIFPLMSGMSITELSLRNTNIGNNALSVLAEALSDSPITKLCISHASIGSGGIRSLAKLIRNKNIIIVDLSYNHIDHKGALELSKVLSKKLEIIKFKISHNPIGNCGVSFISLALSDKKISAVYFSGTQMTDSGVSVVDKLLRSNHYITTVYLSKNKLSKKGAEVIKLITQQNPSITEIKFDYDQRVNNKKHKIDLVKQDLELREKLASHQDFFDASVQVALDDFRLLTKEQLSTLKAHTKIALSEPYMVEGVDLKEKILNSFHNVIARCFEKAMHYKPYDVIREIMSYLDFISSDNLFIASSTYIYNSYVKNKFDRLLASKQLHVVDVDGDGNCFFHALGRQLHLDHREVRAIAVDYMINHTEQFREFTEGNFDQYIDQMSQTGTWADNLAIQALTSELGVNLNIYLLNGEIIRINQVGREDLNVAYTGNHYLSIEPAVQENNELNFAGEQQLPDVSMLSGFIS